jgi:hypothetical protein
MTRPMLAVNLIADSTTLTLVPAWWSEKRKPDATAITTVTTDYSVWSANNFSFLFATISNIAEVSELAMHIAGQADYKHCTIVNTGTTDHICNDFSKFIEWRQITTSSGIKTGAGVCAGTWYMFYLDGPSLLRWHYQCYKVQQCPVHIGHVCIHHLTLKDLF